MAPFGQQCASSNTQQPISGIQWLLRTQVTQLLRRYISMAIKPDWILATPRTLRRCKHSRREPLIGRAGFIAQVINLISSAPARRDNNGQYPRVDSAPGRQLETQGLPPPVAIFANTGYPHRGLNYRLLQACLPCAWRVGPEAGKPK